MIQLEDLCEQSSSSIEQYFISYKYGVWDFKSIGNPILWMILSTLAYTYIELDLLIYQFAIIMEILTFNIRSAGGGYLHFGELGSSWGW